MSALMKILKGLDVSCLESFDNKYYQRLVLVNKADVNQYQIYSNDSFNRITFNLKPGKTGYLVKSNEAGSIIRAGFAKGKSNGVITYNHKVEIPVLGVDENVKTFLKQIDFSRYFAVLMFHTGEVEVFGFNYGMTTEDYDFSSQNEISGIPIPMQSRYPEYEPPYVYRPASSDDLDYLPQVVEDFKNLFSNIQDFIMGDFNDDFSDDFYITDEP